MSSHQSKNYVNRVLVEKTWRPPATILSFDRDTGDSRLVRIDNTGRRLVIFFSTSSPSSLFVSIVRLKRLDGMRAVFFPTLSLLLLLMARYKKNGPVGVGFLTFVCTYEHGDWLPCIK
jgi:hypothetical protein